MSTTQTELLVARLRQGVDFAYLAKGEEGHVIVKDVLKALPFTNATEAQTALRDFGHDGEAVELKYAISFSILEQSIMLKQLRSRRTAILVHPTKTKEERIEEASNRLDELQLALANIEPPTCIGCNKTPDELFEYRYTAKEEGMTPTEFVIRMEGTFSKYVANKFFCTSCYIEREAKRLNEASSR